MTKEPVPHDVMRHLIQLARRERDQEIPYNLDWETRKSLKLEDRETRRARFNAAFSACAGMAQDHPDLALHWLDALKFNQPWRRVKQINTLSTEIIDRTRAEIQPPLF